MPFIAPDRRAGDRFVLRSYEPGDGPAMSEAIDASRDHLESWLPWASARQSPQEQESLARTFRARWLLAEDFVIGIWTADERRLLGGTGFHLRGHWRSAEQGVAEIGLWIRADAAGQGLGTAVLRELLTWGFGPQWPWQRLTWRCDARNERSRRTAVSAGMRLEGTLRGEPSDVGGGRQDTLLFALVRADADPHSDRSSAT